MDEVIVEEGTTTEMNTEVSLGGSSNAKQSYAPYADYLSDDNNVPVVIEASPMRRSKKKKDRSRSRSSSRHQVDLDANESRLLRSLGYENESGEGRRSYYAERNNNMVGAASDAEESFSSRAARARRNRLLSKSNRQQQLDVSGDDDENNNAGVPVKEGGINNIRPPPSSKVSEATADDQYDNSSQSTAWQARKVRMARLRNMKKSIEQEEHPFDNDGGEVIRAGDGMIDCISSDGEDSI